VEGADMERGGEENAHDRAVRNPEWPRGRGCERLREHDERKEEERGVDERLFYGLERIKREIGEHDHRECRDGEGKNEVESLEFACDEESAYEDEPEERHVAADPPTCVSAEKNGGRGNRDAGGIEDVLPVDREDVFRCHRKNGRPYERCYVA